MSGLKFKEFLGFRVERFERNLRDLKDLGGLRFEI